MWIYLGLISALFLGLYDIAKKLSVRDNAVLPVLFLSTVFGMITMTPIMIGSKVAPEFMKRYDLFVPAVSWSIHGLIVLKSVLISFSWSLNFYALKQLPITIVTPIRAAGPFITLLGALFIFGERPSIIQWCGFIIILLSFLAFSRVGRVEGIDFKSNKWIWCIVVSTIAGACSGLYDKYLIQISGIHPQTVQVWFAWYLVVLLGIVVMVFWYPNRKTTAAFQWRWSIPLIGILLIAADFVYFRALADEEALIMILSAVKRSRVFIALIIGGILFKEVNKRKKFLALSGVFVGVLLIAFS